MSNFFLKLNLKKLRNVGVMNINGKSSSKKCIVIPVDDNPCIFVGDKGIYLSATATETSNSPYGDSHMIRCFFSKEKYNAMTEEERRGFGILGNMKPSGGHSSSAPSTESDGESTAAPAPVEYPSESSSADEDDLPF